MRELEFFAAMYLEAVCDESRNRFLAKWSQGQGSTESKIQQFQDRIGTDTYSDLMEEFRRLMGAKKAVMFQSKDQGDLKNEVEYRDITVLASAQQPEDKVDILRSELLDFYRNQDPQKGCPCSTMLLDITDTVRIVQVESAQSDLSVQSYERESCTIAYVRLDYTDQLNDNKTGHIFFAFFYQKMQINQLQAVLEYLQGFLSFRHSLKLRIEKDFNGNLFGKRTEELWRIDWLSIEKAGAHTDSSNVNRLIRGRWEQTDILNILFGKEGGGTDDSSQLLRLTYNIIIAMYYRAVISDERKQFIAADNIEESNESGKGGSYRRIRDLIEFSEGTFSGISIGFGRSQSAQQINDAYLYGADNVPIKNDGIYTGGVPESKSITFRSKYLRAFLVDILCNIETHGAKNGKAEIYIETRENAPGYLVFKNQVDVGQDDHTAWCKRENYRLKQAIEFDHVDTAIPKGISLGCIAHCVQWAGRLVVSYIPEDENVYFSIKLPIIKNKEGVSDGEIVDRR